MNPSAIKPIKLPGSSFIGVLLFIAVGLVVAAGWFLAAAPEKAVPGKKGSASDIERIQGKWKVVSNAHTGFVIPISDSKFGSKLRYTLKPHASPKQIDLEHTDAGARPTTTATGIYSLEKDTLKVCWVHDGARPTVFVEDSESGQYLLVLQRIK